MRAVLSISVAVLLLAGAAPAVAQEADEITPGQAVYAVVVTDTSTGPTGEETVRVEEGELRIACVADGCRVVVEPGFGFLGIVSLDGGPEVTGEAAAPAVGSPCAGGRGARSVDIGAGMESFTASLEQEAVPWLDCPDGTEGYAHARSIRWVGTPVAVDPCIFDDPACAASGGSTSLLAGGGAAAPSVLSALTPPAAVQITPAQWAWTGLLTVVLVLLIAFPTALLNSAVEAGTERFARWRSDRARGAGGEAQEDGASHRDWSRSWWWAAGGVAVASVISAFVDPGFGLNAGSGRVVLSILASFAVDVVLGWMLVVWVVTRVQPSAMHHYTFRPLSLLVVVAAVVFTRLTGFEPGIVFGLVAGVAFGALVGAAAHARVAVVTLGYAFGLALVAWVLYGIAAPSTGDSFGATLLVETLSAIAIGGIAALPIALVPLGGLPGRAIWEWKRPLWAACYAVGLFAFFVVLMPMPFSWAAVGWELWAWIGMYLAYAAVAVTAWLVLTKPWERAPQGVEAAESTAPSEP